MVLFAFKGCNHLVYQVVNVEKFQFYTGVIHCVRKIVGKGVAEGGHGTIVIGAAPFTKQVGETVDEHLGSGFLAVLEEQVLTCFLTAAVFAIAKTAGEAGLLAGAQHYGTGVVVLTERVQQSACKAKVAGHKLTLVLGTVHTCQIEHKICIFAPSVQLLRCRVQIILIHLIYRDSRMGFVLSSLYVLERPAEVFTNEPLGACNKYLHT